MNVIRSFSKGGISCERDDESRGKIDPVDNHGASGVGRRWEFVTVEIFVWWE